ncbi:MAG: Bax inhibitor-1 family protein, partial [Prevotella sp.]|nr:Bax inhibitor-1 family protein [Prevotella sp.]
MEVQDLERRIKEQEYGRGFDFSAAFPALMRKVYLWMTFALAISGMVAYGVATSPNLLRVIYTNKLMFWGIMIAELVLVWKISNSVWKPNRSLASTTLMFTIFAALNGATLSYIFVAFAPAAIIKTFFVTAGTFGVTACFGYFT